MRKITLTILTVLGVSLTIWFLAEGGAGDETGAEAMVVGGSDPEGATSAGEGFGNGRVETATTDEAIDPGSSRAELLLVHGSFVDDVSGEPVAGCRLHRQEGKIRRHLATSDSDGRFAFARLEEEGIVLLASAPLGWRVEAEEVIPTPAQGDGADPLELRVH